MLSEVADFLVAMRTPVKVAQGNHCMAATAETPKPLIAYPLAGITITLSKLLDRPPRLA